MATMVTFQTGYFISIIIRIIIIIIIITEKHVPITNLFYAVSLTNKGKLGSDPHPHLLKNYDQAPPLPSTFKVKAQIIYLYSLLALCCNTLDMISVWGKQYLAGVGRGHYPAIEQDISLSVLFSTMVALLGEGRGGEVQIQSLHDVELCM